jgi:hypothetical protein
MDYGAMRHGDTVHQLMEKLKAAQSEVQEMGEANQLGEGQVLKISNLMGEVFEACERVKNEGIVKGAYGVGFHMLVLAPHTAMHHGAGVLLCDSSFALSLVCVKVETLRIQRNAPAAGPELLPFEVESLERWGETLVRSVMNSWTPYFTDPKHDWPPVCPWLPRLTEEGEPVEVPPMFTALVCNLVRMRLNLWPLVKAHLDEWRIEGENIFPLEHWADDYLHEIMATDPRMVSFVAGAGHIDMNDLARSGPIRRSDVARRGSVDALGAGQRLLLKQGVDFLHRVHGGRFTKQHPATPWQAATQNWPCAQNPRIEDLLGDPYSRG